MFLKILFPMLVLLVGCEQITQLTNPKGDTKAPAEVTGLTALPGDGQVVLSWKDPVDSDFTTVHVRANETELTASKGVQSLVFPALKNGNTYNFKVQTSDQAGNRSVGVPVSSTPVAGTVSVTFDSLGGSLVPPQTGIASGGLVTYPTDPTKAGSAFAGWFTDSSLTTGWDFEANTVMTNRTLYARWGSGAAVGVWFGMQNALEASIDPSVDDMESILVFQADGTYAQYQRRHAVLASTYWAELDENKFYEVYRGRYYWDPVTNSLTFRPKKIDLVRLALLVGQKSEADFTKANANWVVEQAGFKSLDEAKLIWGSSSDWSQISKAYEKKDFTGAGNGSEDYTEYEGSTETLFYGTEVWQKTYLDTVSQETRGGFKNPRATKDFPSKVQPLLPTLPTKLKGASLTLTSPSGNLLYGLTNGVEDGATTYLPIALKYTSSGVSSVQYRLNGGSWTTASSGLDLVPEVKSKFGVHTLEVRGLDDKGATAATKSVEFFYFNTANGADGGMTGQLFASWAKGGTVTTPATNQYQGTNGLWGSSSSGGVPGVVDGFVSLANQSEVSGPAGTALWTSFSGRSTLPNVAGLLLSIRDLPFLSSATAETQNYISLGFQGYNSPKYSQLGVMLSPYESGGYSVILNSAATDTNANPPTTTFVQLGGSTNYATFSAPDWTPPPWTASGAAARYTLGLLKDGSTYWGLVIDQGSITVDSNNKPTNHATIVAKVSYSGSVSIPDADVLGVGVGLRNLGASPTRFPEIMGMWK